MKAKGYFWLLAGVLLTVLGFLMYIIIRQRFSWYLVGAEALILLVLLLLYVLYTKTVKPLEIIGSGMDLLRAQDFSSRLGLVGQQDADRIVDIFNKMMAQLKDERLHIREQNQFLDLLVKSSPMGVIILDFDDLISVINPAAVDMLGADETDALGKPVNEIGHGHLPHALVALEQGASATVRNDDGNIFKCSCADFLDRGFHHKFYLVEKMTDELLKAEKRAYAQVIRMMSHEVNNSMAGIASGLDTVREVMGDGLEGSQVVAKADGTQEGRMDALRVAQQGGQMDAQQGGRMDAQQEGQMVAQQEGQMLAQQGGQMVAKADDLKGVPNDGAQGAQTIAQQRDLDDGLQNVSDNVPNSGDIVLNASDAADIRSLLAVSSERCISLSAFISAFANVVKIPEPQFQQINLNDFISNRLRFFESLCESASPGKKISFDTHFSPSVGTVVIDPILMEQVIVNIIKNAAEAIESQGSICIETGFTQATPQHSATPTLVISDNGKGISAEAEGKLFTPFFSTKLNGQGIGLIVIRDILIKHHCGFSLRTRDDGWTRFEMVFVG